MLSLVESLEKIWRLCMGSCLVSVTSLHNRIETKPDYQIMAKKNRFCTMKLHNLARKNCNVSTIVVKEDVIGNLIEDLFNFALIKGD